MKISELRATSMDDRQILERTLYALARAREDAQDLKEHKEDAYEAMMQTIEGQEYQAVQEEYSEAQAAAKEFKKMAAQLAIELFDGEDKDVAPGASIAVYTNFVLHDDQAVKWALDNGHGILLKPDKAGFESMKDRLPLEIYDIEETPRARISRKDLSEMYPSEGKVEDPEPKREPALAGTSVSEPNEYEPPF